MLPAIVMSYISQPIPHLGPSLQIYQQVAASAMGDFAQTRRDLWAVSSNRISMRYRENSRTAQGADEPNSSPQWQRFPFGEIISSAPNPSSRQPPHRAHWGK